MTPVPPVVSLLHALPPAAIPHQLSPPLPFSTSQEVGAAGKLSRNDLTGGTFTLSNIGAVGGTYCRPVLVIPEVVIGAIGKTRRLPRFGPQDSIVAAHIMEVCACARSLRIT